MNIPTFTVMLWFDLLGSVKGKPNARIRDLNQPKSKIEHNKEIGSTITNNEEE